MTSNERINSERNKSSCAELRNEASMKLHLSLLWLNVAVASVLKGPVQAPSYNPGNTGDASKQQFLDHELAIGLPFNKYFVDKPEEHTRISTWNIHMLKDVFGKKSAVEEFLEELPKFQADVFGFQEVPLPQDGPEFLDWVNGMKALGYEHTLAAYCDSMQHVTDPWWRHGVMIASKYPLEFQAAIKLDYGRMLLHAKAQLDTKSIDVLVTHLEVSHSTIRQAQVELILSYIVQADLTDYILLGDLNSQYIEPEFDIVRVSGQFNEVFRELEWTPPEYTCWAGSSIDYVLASPDLCQYLHGAYTYHSVVSDHLPVLVDLII